MAQHSQSYRKSLRSALRNKKLADAIIDSIHDLQVFAAANGGTISSQIVSSAITRDTTSQYKLLATDRHGLEGISSYRKVFRSALNNKALADKILNIILELQGYAGTADAQLNSITTIADVVAEAEVTEITCVADVSDSLDGTYFILQDTDGSVAFWIDTDDSGTAEPSHGADRSVEITTIATDDSAATIAGKLETAIHADSKFTASSADAVVTVTNVDTEDLDDAADGDTGFTFSTTNQGVTAASLDGLTFILEDADGTVGFWFDVDNSGTTIPAEATACDRAVEITTITTGMTAAQVGDAVYTAVCADSKFAAGSNDNAGNLVITNVDEDYFPNVSASTSGFTVTVSDVGSAASTQEQVVEQAITAGASPYATSNLKALTSALCHASLASALLTAILELQTEFRDGLLGTCSGTLTNDLITV